MEKRLNNLEERIRGVEAMNDDKKKERDRNKVEELAEKKN